MTGTHGVSVFFIRIKRRTAPFFDAFLPGKSCIFPAGVLFGTAGIKVLGSKDAKKAYAHTTAAVPRPDGQRDGHDHGELHIAHRPQAVAQRTGKEVGRFPRRWAGQCP